VAAVVSEPPPDRIDGSELPVPSTLVSIMS